MPLYRGEVVKSITVPGGGSHQWRNVYTISAVDQPTALSSTDHMRILEQAVHYSVVTFLYVRVKLIGSATPSSQLAINQPGALTPLTDVLPLWVTARVIFTDTVGGRPENKYLRLPLYTSSVTDGDLSSEMQTFLQDNYATPAASYGNYVGPTGEAHASGTVQAALQMRQEGWHRRVRPGFKRGWVPT